MSYTEEITQRIIRPLRDQYRIGKLGTLKCEVGPRGFTVSSRLSGRPLHVERCDFTVVNPHGHKLHASHYCVQKQGAQVLPVVVFVHSNNGSRVEGLQYVEACLQQELELVLFDCSGSGVSEGDFVTLGVRESEDLEVVVEHLRTSRGVKEVALWGRSMGAVTALMYASRFSSITRACIYDSPFSCLRKLVKQLAKQKTGLPEFFFHLFMSGVEDNLRQKCGIDFEDFKLEQIAARTTVPAIFITSKIDKMISFEHSRLLYEQYRGQKQLLFIDSEHSEPRQAALLDKCFAFIKSKTGRTDEQPRPGFLQRQPLLTSRDHKESGGCFGYMCMRKEQQYEFKGSPEVDYKGNSRNSIMAENSEYNNIRRELSLQTHPLR